MTQTAFTMNLSLGSEIFETYSVQSAELLNSIPSGTFHALLIENDKLFQELPLNNGHRLIPVYQLLRNNSEFSNNSILAQIDYLGEEIPPYFCPNNPKLDTFIEKVFKSYNNSYNIAGIQLTGLEMPPLTSHLGCFCEYCISLAEKNDLDLLQISKHLRQLGPKKQSSKWIHKKFPDLIKFRTASINNLAGRLMMLIRKINPNLTLGVNLPYSKNPKNIGQDYFFLALYLDSVNFKVENMHFPVQKKVLKQIRSITKNFLGEIKVYLQVRIPNKLNKRSVMSIITQLRKYSFTGIVFHITNLNEMEKFVKH
ncbi:MAG: hypothetical protein ACTSQI_04665 [Candidatus Helarchaeota archaeon]